MQQSVLDGKRLISSPLENLKSVRPEKTSSKGRMLAASLMLTSLVDVFSILVIYLIFNSSSSSETLDIAKDMNLPTSEYQQLILDSVQVKALGRGLYQVEDTRIADSEVEGLLKEISKLRTEAQKPLSLAIQSDRSLSFEEVNPILIAASRAGFETIKFASIGSGKKD